MNIATVDLDDTLIDTNSIYENCRTNYCDYLNNKFGFDPETVEELIVDIDTNLFSSMGLSKERFPKSFVLTANTLLKNEENVDLEYEKQTAYEFANEVYLTGKEYSNKGFMDDAKKMLNELDTKYDRLHLLTVGVPSVQNPKIKALNLDNWFNSIHIEKLHGKKDRLNNLKSTYDINEIVHIGNSEKSDVQAAINANVKSIYIPNSQWMGTTDRNYEDLDNVLVFESLNEYITYLRKNI